VVVVDLQGDVPRPASEFGSSRPPNGPGDKLRALAPDRSVHRDCGPATTITIMRSPARVGAAFVQELRASVSALLGRGSRLYCYE
jgi:hypothetical protein